MASSSRNPPPSQQQPTGTYTVQQGSELTVAARKADMRQLRSAANYIIGIFEANRLPYALMGGFSMNIRGSGRATHDVDVAVGCDMLQLVQVLSPQSRILRPLGPVSGVMRIFVRTGGQIDPGVPELFVGVDLILRGSLGAPDNPQTASEVLTAPTSIGAGRYIVLNLLNIMGSKLGAFFARASLSDYDDIVFLMNTYPQDIWAIRSQLNQAHRQAFITAYAQRTPSQGRLKAAKQMLGIA